MVPPELAPVRRGPAPWALRGARAGATSWVALGLVLALTLAARSRPALVGVAATTALAVPAGICLGALGALPLEPRFVDLVAALSVAYVAATNTLVRKPRTLWPESVLFGVVQGASIGAALAIAPMLEEMRWEASPDGTVVVFAVGLGLVAAAVAPLLGLGRRLPGLERGRVVLSALLALAGLGAFAQRAGWIPL